MSRLCDKFKAAYCNSFSSRGSWSARLSNSSRPHISAAFICVEATITSGAQFYNKAVASVTNEQL